MQFLQKFTRMFYSKEDCIWFIFKTEKLEVSERSSVETV